MRNQSVEWITDKNFEITKNDDKAWVEKMSTVKISMSVGEVRDSLFQGMWTKIPCNREFVQEGKRLGNSAAELRTYLPPH